VCETTAPPSFLSFPLHLSRACLHKNAIIEFFHEEK
jgi:hypothetical protein